MINMQKNYNFLGKLRNWTPIGFIGFKSFYRNFLAYLNLKHAPQLEKLRLQGFSSDLKVYIREYTVWEYYCSNPLQTFAKASSKLETFSDLWNTSIYSDSVSGLKTAHSSHITIKVTSDKPHEFIVSGALSEQMLKDSLTVSCLINDMIYKILVARKMSPVYVMRLLSFSSPNEETLPGTIVNKLIYSRRVSYNWDRHSISKDEINQALMFFSSLKKYQICLEDKCPGSVQRFSSAVEFMQRINGTLQSISACADTVIQAIAKFPELTSNSFNFCFQDINCNSVVTRKIIVDQCVKIEDAYVYNCTKNESKICAQTNHDYLFLLTPNTTEYLLSDLIIKAMYHRFGSIPVDNTFLMYQDPDTKFTDNVSEACTLEQSLCFYDRVLYHLIP